MTYLKMSEKISEAISKEMDYDNEKKLVLTYALENLFLTVTGFVIITMVGYMLGIMYEVLAVAVVGGSLRLSSGGSHNATPLGCLFTGTIMYTLIGYSVSLIYSEFGGELWLHIVMLILCVLFICIVYKYAPVDSVAKPIVSKEYRQRLRIISIITMLCYTLIVIININNIVGMIVVGGLVVQVISLLPKKKKDNPRKL